MACKYGEIFCSEFHPCEYHVREEKLKLREKERCTTVGFFNVRPPLEVIERRVIVERPIVVERTRYVEDSSPGLSLLAAGAGALVGALIAGSGSNRNDEIDVTPRRKALPPHRKNGRK